MGRKIPAKKHRGVKDPLEQQARRFLSIKGKINAPPKDPDEQPVPQSLTRLFACRDKQNNRVKNKKKPKQAPSPRDGGPASSVGQNPIAQLKKLPGESGRGFSLRINSAIKTLHEQEYLCEEEAEDSKGAQMAAQRARRLRKRTQAARAAGDDAPPEKLTRGQKLTLKKNAKKLKAAEARQERPELLYERVSFGDVTHAPPALPPPRRAPRTAAAGAPRPGRRELLLSALLAGRGGAGEPRATAAERLRRERLRLDAVVAYRQLNEQRRREQSGKRKAAPHVS